MNNLGAEGAYTDTEVAWVGLTEGQAKAQGTKVKKGLLPWTVSGRAIANDRGEDQCTDWPPVRRGHPWFRGLPTATSEDSSGNIPHGDEVAKMST